MTNSKPVIDCFNYAPNFSKVRFICNSLMMGTDFFFKMNSAKELHFIIQISLEPNLTYKIWTPT